LAAQPIRAGSLVEITHGASPIRDTADTIRGRCYFIVRTSSEPAREIMEQSPTAPEAEVLRAPVVLIVEDEFSVRWPAAEYLREIAYSVIEASNANDAITVLMSGAPIDLAFVDFKLPGGLNGLMLAKWLDAHRPTMPVLLTSGLAETLPGF
jgi:PleD family two-component response regulator